MNVFKVIFEVKELKNDFIISIVMGVVLLMLIHYFNLNFVFHNIYENLEVIITISVTMTGFLITSLTILLVFPENNRIKFIKKHTGFIYIFYAFILSIMLFITVSILSFALKILISFKSYFFLYLLIIIFSWAIVSLFRCIWLLKKMIDILFLE